MPAATTMSPDCNTLGLQSLPSLVRPYSYRKAITHHEYIARARHHSSLSQDLQHIPELTMDVTTHRHGRLNRLNIRFFQQKISDPSTQQFHLSFRQVLALQQLVVGQLRIHVEVDTYM